MDSKQIQYIDFDQGSLDELLTIVNEDSLRTHLIDHPYFDRASLAHWMDEKAQTDHLPGCRVKIIKVDDQIAGWCGIQPDEQGYELAIVLGKAYWGIGISVFKEMLKWSKALGHTEVVFHLLESRPQYKALQKMSTKVVQTQLLGRQFTTYTVSV
jgi:RimJ/RimL family protein N-acetyltransferase